MPNPPSNRAWDACPHCGGTVGFTLLELLPSRDNKRTLVCKSCGGRFDLANGSKMAAVMSGMIGMALGTLYPFAWIVKAGGGTKVSIAIGIAAVLMCMLGAAAVAARLTFSLEKK